MKKVLVIIIGLFLLLPNVYAIEEHNYGVTQHEQQLINKEKAEKRTIFEDLKYKFIDNDKYDNYVYLILGIVIITILIILVIKKIKSSKSIEEESVFEN